MSNDTASPVTASWGQLKLTSFTIILILIDVLAIFGNTLVIVVVLWTKDLRRKEANFFVVSLSIADLLVALTILPMTIASLASSKSFIYYNQGYKTLHGFGNFFFCICSIMNLTLLSLDRYFSIIFPYLYLKFMTPKKACLMCIIIWIYSLALSLPPGFGISSYSCFIPNVDTCSERVWRSRDTLVFAVIVLGFTYVFSLASMSFCYWKIFKVARSHSRQIAAQQPVRKTISENRNNHCQIQYRQNRQNLEIPNEKEEITSQNGKAIHTDKSANPKKNGIIHVATEKQLVLVNALWTNKNEGPTRESSSKPHITVESSEESSSSSHRGDNNFHNEKNEMRVARSFLIIIGFYVLCWTPFCLILGAEIFIGTKLTEEGSLVCLWIGYINSCVNPFLYTWKYRQFRKALIGLWEKVKH